MSKPGSRDPKKQRVFVLLSRQLLIDSKFSSVICAPVYSSYDGLSTQVRVSTEDGLKHESSIHCHELLSLPKSLLTRYVGQFPPGKLRLLERALREALELDS